MIKNLLKNYIHTNNSDISDDYLLINDETNNLDENIIKFKPSESIGITFLTSPENSYPKIVYIFPNSQAFLKGLRCGDIIKKINNIDLKYIHPKQIEDIIKSIHDDYTIERQNAKIIKTIVGPWNKSKYSNIVQCIDNNPNSNELNYGYHNLLVRL